MDPGAARTGGLSDFASGAIQGVLRRQPEFESAETVLQRYRAAPAFANWTLEAYIRHGFAAQEDGRVRLHCTPELESAIPRPIFEAMEQVYTGDARGNPFARLSEIGCPVRVATAEKSWPVYKEMVSRAVALIPTASRWTFDGVGHCVGQEDPGLLLDALRIFGTEDS